MILCGNQRYKALKEIGYKEIPEEWIKTADDLTEDQKRELMIKDNIQAGDWNFDELDNWNKDELEGWGLEMPKESEISMMETQELKPFKKSHILISFDPEDLTKIEKYITEIQAIENIELEFGSN